TLSEALAEHPKTFSQLYVGTVAAGEASGHLDYALNQLGEHLSWQQEITSQLRQATTYPIIVLLAVGVLLSVLVGFVFPKLFPIFASLDVQLPLPTRIIIVVAHFLRTWWPVLLGGLVGLVLLFVVVRRTPRGRYLTDKLMLHLPIFGPLAHQITMARFVTYTALFYRTGVELLHGLTLVERMIENRVVARAIHQARDAVAGGDSMASAFGRTGLFPLIVVRSIALGENTGSLDDALTRAKTYYDREVPAAVRRMLTALQPAMVVVLGAVILVVALSIFLPVITIYKSVGR
ncbi:MAG TPA: type II secretion system F family protein, partial [Longimicrobiales bacterium]|nr:type II secretion system F family protein [Longimicrobiales bacterium]